MELSRRNALKTLGITALGAGAALGGLSLTGCSGEQARKPEDYDPQNEYLPLGSVVTLYADEGTEIKRMIVVRKPYITALATSPDATQPAAEDEWQHPMDYGVVYWPIGFFSNLSDKEFHNEIVAIPREQIKEVLFAGYVDDQEEAAAKTLNDNLDSDQTGTALLSEQFADIASFKN